MGQGPTPHAKPHAWGGFFFSQGCGFSVRATFAEKIALCSSGAVPDLGAKHFRHRGVKLRDWVLSSQCRSAAQKGSSLGFRTWKESRRLGHIRNRATCSELDFAARTTSNLGCFEPVEEVLARVRSCVSISFPLAQRFPFRALEILPQRSTERLVRACAAQPLGSS